MDPNQVLRSDLDDLIFEGRNKDYGAYELRKHYRRRMTIALMSTGVVLAMSIMGNIIAQERQHGTVIPKDYVVVDIVHLPEKEPKPVVPPPAAKLPAAATPPRSITFTPPVIVDREDVKDVPTVDDTKRAVISDVTIDGPEDQGDVLPKVPGVPSGGGVIVGPSYDPNEIFTGVSIEASTDVKAWIRHLQRTLEYPAMEAAEKGLASGNYTVQVRFVVEKDGSVSQVSALNDPGYGLADAAVKAVSKGPRWSPGEQNGIKVRSWHTQPITFSVTSGE